MSTVPENYFKDITTKMREAIQANWEEHSRDL